MKNPDVTDSPERVAASTPAMGSVLGRGVTHPQIHVDYYEWLGNVKAQSYASLIINEIGFEQFHRVAMWAWSQSRETLNVKAQNAALSGADNKT